MPLPPRTGGPPVTNIRNTSSLHWHASSRELTNIVTGLFDDLSALLPANVSDHFVGGFGEAVQRVWRGAGPL
jgi:hypothetical protein